MTTALLPNLSLRSDARRRAVPASVAALVSLDSLGRGRGRGGILRNGIARSPRGLG